MENLEYEKSLKDNNITYEGHSGFGIAMFILIVYGALFYFSLLWSPVFALFLFIYILLAIGIGAGIYSTDEEKINEDKKYFTSVNPFSGYGKIIESFSHVFVSNSKNVINEVIIDILDETKKIGFSKNSIEFLEDVDERLLIEDKRKFFISKTNKGFRGAAIIQIFHIYSEKNIHSVRWWLLISGYKDYSDTVKFVLLSPFTIFTTISNKFNTRNYNVTNNSGNINNSFYENIDSNNKLMFVQKISFETLIETLDKNGIDTSDLIEKRGQMMNINVSGGKASFSSIMQGSKNNINRKK